MAEFLRSHPELEPFVLSDVRLTGTYHNRRRSLRQRGGGSRAWSCLRRQKDPRLPECSPSSGRSNSPGLGQVRSQLMSTLRHPNIVQFFGLCFLPGSQLPALDMERLLTSLHDLMDPQTDVPPPLSDAPKPFFPLSLKCSIMHDVASGLTYIHGKSPPIIHQDLSARNVLLNSGMVANIADLGVARIVPRMRAAAIMTKGPGAGVYMPPEALESKPGKQNEDKNQSMMQALISSLLPFLHSAKPSPVIIVKRHSQFAHYSLFNRVYLPMF